MRYFDSIAKAENETWEIYFSRFRYAILRRFHPRYREQYRLESLVGPRNVWNQLAQYQFNILSSHDLKPEHTLLDIGCGPLTVGLRLISFLNKGNYVGVDLRPEPLVEAYRLIAKHSLANKNPTLVNSSTFGKNELAGRTFDYIYMSQLSCHLDDESMTKLFEQVRASLKPDSVFLFDIIDPNLVLPPDAIWSGFAFHQRPLEFYVDLAKRFDLYLQTRGQIVDFGYPEHINLKSNLLLEVRAVPIQKPVQLKPAFSAKETNAVERKESKLVPH
jgi:SAM-dependent methyltransferase